MRQSPLRKDLLSRLDANLSPSARGALDACRLLAADQGLSLFLVGGAVRDLLLGRDSLDLDLALEAPVAPFAQTLAAATGGRVVGHSRFDTATVSDNGFQIDLARTRRETYARPGALPDVEPGSLHDDLARRDFTVNALALRLTHPAGELIDLHGGQRDIAARLIRVLHERSFQDDATRMLRAVRYAARLGFAIEPATSAWLRRDLSFLDRISGARLRRELILLFAETAAIDAVEIAESLGVLAAIHPDLKLRAPLAGRWREALAGPRYAPLDELGFCVLLQPDAEAAAAALSSRLHLGGRIEKALRDLVRLQTAWAKLATARGSPSQVVELLDTLAPAAVWAFTILAEPSDAEVCRQYLQRWRGLRPELTGKDLLAIGLAPGSAVGEALRMLRRARIEGRVSTRRDEVALIEGLI